MKKPKVGRNVPCPCGSSLKYKKCCLPNQEATPAPQGDVQYGAVPETIEQLYASIHQIAWTQPQYGDMASGLVPHLEGRYTLDEINATILIWFAYSREHAPVVQKPGVMFAALEYSLALMTGRTGVTKTALAKHYQVSPGSVSKRMLELNPFIERTFEALAG